MNIGGPCGRSNNPHELPPALRVNKEMPFRRLLIFSCFGLFAMQGSAAAHQIGFAEQMLQPVTASRSLVALLAVALVCRQQTEFALDRALVVSVGSGLMVGFFAEIHDSKSHLPTLFALSLAALAGGLVVLNQPLNRAATYIVFLGLGGAVGSNLTWESDDWIDMVQTLLGALVGTLVALHFLTTTANPPTSNIAPVAFRILGSWIVAIALLLLTLDVHNLSIGRALPY